MRIFSSVTGLVTALACAGLAGPGPLAAQEQAPPRPQADAIRPQQQRGDEAQDQTRRGVQADADVEVLTRGPVHEAFATPITADPEPGIVIKQEPPKPIQELPPEAQPEGAVWIPGYWSWAPDREDFIWISGVWRIPPPGSEWVPGYWAEAQGGYQWVPGFWNSTEVQQVSYLPPPPETVEEGPTSPAPSDDDIWVPGTWVWYENDYLWRPGYWITAREGWDWVPAHYVWTPSGYVFVDSYWDFVPVRRGMLFAPVYFTQPVYAQAGYYYSPDVVLDLGLFTAHLFVYPGYYHYYFGDYYGSRYANFGILPWYDFGGVRFGYDPIYAYYDWSYRRRGLNWSGRVRGWFDYVSGHEDFRPPHTFTAFRDLRERRGDRLGAGMLVAQSLSDVERSRNLPFKLERLDKDRRREIGQRDRLQAFGTQRAQMEAKATGEVVGGRRRQATTLKLPEAPIRARAGGEGSAAAPQRPKVPEPDRRVRPGQVRRPRRGALPQRPEPRKRPGARPEQPESRKRPGARPEQPEPRKRPGARPEQPESRERPGARPQRSEPRERPGSRQGRSARRGRPDVSPGQRPSKAADKGKDAPGEKKSAPAKQESDQSKKEP